VSPSGCCLGLDCDSATSTCSSCMTLGSGCTGPGQCCTSLYCSEPGTGYTSGCATPGTCACDTCLPVLTPCTFGGSSCCGAAQCLTATNAGCGETDTDCTCQENL
jgi:hypothetical protein